jgi:putative transposase
MREMGLEAVYPKPNLSKCNLEHKKYLYLLRGVTISRPNQVWAGDITYIPLQDGFGYLFAIIDWFSHMLIAWQISNLLDTAFCLEALESALSVGRPEIFNTNQGVQFTSSGFTGRLEAGGIKISMDGKGRAFDNIMVERLWRTVKYEDVYLKGYTTLPEARQGIGTYFSFYNERRPHQSLGYRTPQEVYALSG